MGIASSMKELVEGIASSHEDRTKMALEIREEAKRVTGDARVLVKDFQTSRLEAGVELRKELVRDKENRKSDVKSTLADAQGLMKGFRASRKKEGSQLRKKLSQGTAERKSEVSSIRGDARQTISTFQSQRKKTGNKLRGELARSRSSRESEIEELRKDAQDLVKGFAKSREESGEILRKNLAKSRAERESAVKTIVSEVDEIRAGIRKDQAETREEISRARDAWQELTRRSKPLKKAAFKEDVAKAVPTEAELPDLEARLLAAINEHSQGITLTEVAESLGVAPVVFGRAAKKLVDGGKVRKEDKAYFPVASK